MNLKILFIIFILSFIFGLFIVYILLNTTNLILGITIFLILLIGSGIRKRNEIKFVGDNL